MGVKTAKKHYNMARERRGGIGSAGVTSGRSKKKQTKKIASHFQPLRGDEGVAAREEGGELPTT